MTVGFFNAKRHGRHGNDRVRWLPRGTQQVTGRERTAQTPLSPRPVLWLSHTPDLRNSAEPQGLDPSLLCIQINTCCGGVRKTETDSSQWCPVTGLEAMSRDQNTRTSTKQRKNIFLLWRWVRIGTGCPQRLWSLHPCRYSKPSWTQSWAAGCRWPCLRMGVGLDDLQRSLPASMILFNAVALAVIVMQNFSEWAGKCRLWAEVERLDHERATQVLLWLQDIWHLDCGCLQPLLAQQWSACQRCQTLSVFLLNHRIREWFGLEGTLKIVSFQHPYHAQRHLPPDQVA